jgi:shikimate kinase
MTPATSSGRDLPAHRHVLLVGMMGAGKSTVGPILARRLDRPFVDVDDLVTATAGRSIPELFASDGETAFRALERVALADACASPEPLVIAAGGGAMSDPKNRNVASAAATVVWLQADAASLAARVVDDAPDQGGSRPLLAGGDPVLTLKRLALLRADAYAAVADIVVTTDDRSADEVADTVHEELARCDA